MRHEMAIVKNITLAQGAYEALSTRDLCVPGMGLFHGKTGYGKTTSIAWLVNQVNGIYVRALAAWTPTFMLQAIMSEMGADPSRYSASMVNYIVEELAMTGRPLFVDEVDHIMNAPSFGRMIETLRDIHDLSQAPVVMVGMEGIEKRIKHRKQLSRRISQWVEFKPADIKDTRIVADTVCEIKIEDDLLKYIHDEAKGNIGNMVVGMARIEKLAKANGWKKVDAGLWGKRDLFLGQR